MNEDQFITELRGMMASIRIGVSANGQVSENVSLRAKSIVDRVELSFTPNDPTSDSTAMVWAICERLRHIAAGQCEWPRNELLRWLKIGVDMIESIARNAAANAAKSIKLPPTQDHPADPWALHCETMEAAGATHLDTAKAWKVAHPEDRRLLKDVSKASKNYRTERNRKRKAAGNPA